MSLEVTGARWTGRAPYILHGQTIVGGEALVVCFELSEVQGAAFEALRQKQQGEMQGLLRGFVEADKASDGREPD